MKNIDGKHQKEKLKNATQYDLEQNTNALASKLILSLFEVINFKMLEAMKKC